jgi:peptide/nickel transport system permease protein
LVAVLPEVAPDGQGAAAAPGGGGSEFSVDPAAAVARAEGRQSAGVGPWRLALRRLRRNKAALAFGALFIVMVATALAAPIWSKDFAKTTPFENRVSDQITVDGKKKDIVAPDGAPIGPTWTKQYFLGADGNGRDIMVRLLYGGRNSLFIGVLAAVVTSLLSVFFGLIAGYFRGWSDAIIARTMDVIWAFPVILLGVALGTALALGGLKIGPITVQGDSKWIPILVIAVVYIPYMARPIRGEVLAMREREFVEAARAQGAGPLRIMFSEILPNLATTIVVFFPLMVANAIGLEAALSFLGAGVRPPEPSWGTLINDGVDRIITAPHLAIAPGIMLVLTVLSLNVFGDGVRDALDPRAKVRIER